ncbi:MAG: kinase [Rhodospirillales bacterium]
MIITRTPYRVSLFGGGSDYPTWFREHGGRVLGMAIDKYCYITVRELPPFFEHRHRIVYSKQELVNTFAEIQHPAVRGILEALQPQCGIEMHHDGDLPARSGLGSSSSFTVGLIHALNVLAKTDISRFDLAKVSIDLEQQVIDKHVGSQDQIWAAYGGLNRIDFHRDDSFTVTPLNVTGRKRKALSQNLVLFFSGITRRAPVIAEKQIGNLHKKAANIHRMMEMVDEAEDILADADAPLAHIGELLHESWCLKRQLADGVSTDVIDDIYQAAREAGAVGGKLLGAGGGGFMLFYVEPDHRDAVRQALGKLIEVDFKIDDDGSEVIFGR